MNYSNLCSVNYKIDKEKPKVTIAIDNKNSISKTKTAKITITDSGESGIKRQTISYGWNQVGASTLEYNTTTIDNDHNVIEVPLENKTGKYRLYVKQGILDNAGNQTDMAISDVVEVDNIAPTIVVKTYKAASTTSKTGSIISDKTNENTELTEWNNTGYYFDLSSSSDSGGSGIDRITWKYNKSNIFDSTYNASANMKNGKDLTSPTNAYKTLTDQGIRYGEMEIFDKAGNSRKVFVKVNVDTTIPTCSIAKSGTTGDNGWYKANDVTLTLTRSDTGGSSLVSGYGFKTTNSASYELTGNSNLTKTQGNTTGITWYGFVKDTAGNVGTCNSGTIKVDKSAPDTPIAYILKKGSGGGALSHGADIWRNYTITWNISQETDDNGPSKIDHYEYDVDGDGIGRPANSSYEYYEDYWNGNYRARAVDKAGNASSWTSTFYIRVDKKAPTVWTYTPWSGMTVTQWDTYDNVVSSSIKNRSCSGNTCTADICLSRKEGSFYPFNEVGWSDNVTVSVNRNSSVMKDYYGTIISYCSVWDVRPCTYTVTYTAGDPAGNYSNFYYIYKVRYYGDGGGC